MHKIRRSTLISCRRNVSFLSIIYVSYLEKTLRQLTPDTTKYPYLWDYMGIHDIYWLDFVQRIHPPNFTPVGVILGYIHVWLEMTLDLFFCED